MKTKLQRRICSRGWLPYRDGRGQENVYASYRMPRKLKKALRKIVVGNVLKMPHVETVRWKLWWKPRIGWTLMTLARKDRRRGS